MKLPKNIYAVSFLSALLSTACAQQNNFTATAKPLKTANPASQKCINDGYQLRAISSQTGVVSEYNCVNPINGKQCEEWAYFRQHCTLN